jgi:hypothetical protein
MLLVGICGCLVTVQAAPAELGSLSIRTTAAGAQFAGYAYNLDGSDIYWFVLQGKANTVLRDLHAGTYQVRLLCSTIQQSEARVAVEADTGAQVVFEPDKPPEAGTETVSENNDIVRLGLSATYYKLNSCGLQDIVLPVLLKERGLVAPDSAISEEVARLSGPRRIWLSLKSPVELLLGEMFSVEMERRYYQVQRLLADQAKVWAENKGKIMAKTSMNDSSLLGMVVTAVPTSEIEEDGTITISIKYFPSEENPVDIGENSYELEITESPMAQSVSNLQVTPVQENKTQQIAPVVHEGLWQFVVKALPDFRSYPISFHYDLQRIAKGKGRTELSEGLLGESIPLTVKAKEPIPKLSFWQRTKTFFQESGGLVGWIAATVLAVLQILQLLGFTRIPKELPRS